MTSQEILKADVLDIVFDNRNKTYGAYELRKHYNNRLGFALGAMLSALLIVIFALNNFPGETQNLLSPTTEGPVTVLDLTPVPKVEKPVLPKTPPAVKQRNFVNQIKIVSDDVTDMPDQIDLHNALISDKDVEGPAFTEAKQPAVTPVTEEPVAKVEEPKKEFTSVEKNAEFPGGQAAWIAFLSRHLRTPSELEAGQKKTVYVRFVVDVDGSISKFEIVQSGGAAFDNEVIRVLKKMPKWTPAFQNGHNVSVIFTQPVTFMAFEE